MSAVFVNNLVVRYVTRTATITAIDGVSFDAELGTVTALLGPNGAGKTTTVETLEGYRRPTPVPCGCSISIRSPAHACSHRGSG